MNYTYGCSAHAHAVTALSDGSQYAYDQNGNMIKRVTPTESFTQTFDAENRLVSVQTLRLFADGFESGNFSTWTSSATDGGNLAAGRRIGQPPNFEASQQPGGSVSSLKP